MDAFVDLPRCVGFPLCAALIGILSITAAAREPQHQTASQKGQQTVVDGLNQDLNSLTPGVGSVSLFRLGQSVVPLYGPWAFHVNDSPVDPVTHLPLWAETGFDDSAWETVILTPPRGRQSGTDEIPAANILNLMRAASRTQTEVVPGWTTHGHEGYAGFAWYRIHLNLEIRPWERLALLGPFYVDDAYEVYLDGKVLGSFGDLNRRRPVTYYNQPMMFPFTAGNNPPASTTHVIAFRLWMEPNTLETTEESGGLRSAPVVGEANAVAIGFQLKWLELIRSYSPFIIDAFSFALLAVMTFSFILFDRSDRVYPWMGIALILMAAYNALGAFDLLSKSHLSILEDRLLVRCLLGPLAFAGWFMVWWEWFHRHKPAWLPVAAAGSAVGYMVSSAISFELSSSLKWEPVAVAFHYLSMVDSLFFFCLLSSVVTQGVRRYGLDGWLVLPAVALLAIPAIQTEPWFLHLSPTWFVFGAAITMPEIANLVFALVVALLLLRRLLLSVRRQRLIELDAKRAQLQSDFVAAVSHEFRTPLTALRSITDLLVQDRICDEARRRQSYVFLDRETNRLHRLVEDLLDFGRMDSGRKQYRFETFDVFQSVRAAITDIGEQVEAGGFEIETDLVPVSASIHADEEAVRRAIRNLIDNAMRYSPQCRTVWVDGKVDHHRVSISIRDRGIGVDASEQRAIFQKFFRGAAAKRAGIKGTGIGLAMVQQISEAMGGEVQLRSELGVGSTFTILLPLAKE